MIQFILKMKVRNIFYVSLCVSGFLLILYQTQINSLFQRDIPVEELPRIIWWTPFTLRNDLEVVTCGDFQCAVTDNREYYNNTMQQAFLFYASNFVPYDLPFPRTKKHVWGIMHEESPKNLALFLHDDSLRHFNYSATFSRFSDVPLTLQYLSSLDLLTDFTYFKSTTTKNSYLDKLAPVLYIQSDCQTPLERDSYVAELMKYIKVDSYGKCLNNKVLPKKFEENPLENLYAKDFMEFVSQYKFVIAFENSVCDDYITEKLWRPLIVGSVPIYMGSPSVTDWLPNGEKSAILAQNFASPKELAKYIHEVNNNKYMYESYLQHKLSDLFKITNHNLSAQFNTVNSEEQLFNKFECQICENMYLNVVKNSLTRKEYNCPSPISPLTGNKNLSNWWIEHWQEGGCHAKVFSDLVYKQNNIKEEIYDERVNTLIENKKCQDK